MWLRLASEERDLRSCKTEKMKAGVEIRGHEEALGLFVYSRLVLTRHLPSSRRRRISVTCSASLHKDHTEFYCKLPCYTLQLKRNF